MECSHRDHTHLDQRHTPAETLLSLHYSDKQPGEQRREMGESRRNEAHEKGDTKTFVFFFKLAVQFVGVLHEVFHEFLSAFLLRSQILVITFASTDFIKRFHPSGVPLKWPDTAYLKEPHKLRRTESFADFRFASWRCFETVFPNLLGEYFMLKLTTCKAVLRS